MAKNDFEVTFTSNIEAFYDEFDPAVKKALTEIGIEAEKHAKEIITEKGAVDTGRLRNSITHQVGETDNKEPCVYIGTNVSYAPWVEGGTSRMKERPFIRPAVEDFGEEYKKIVENNFGEIK